MMIAKRRVFFGHTPFFYCHFWEQLQKDHSFSQYFILINQAFRTHKTDV